MSTPEKTASDPAYDILQGLHRKSLDAIFNPRNVAVIGATERAGSVGRSILWNLISSPFGGTVFPVNSAKNNVLGIRAYPSIKAIPEPIDLAVIVTPSSSVPGLIAECVDTGVPGAIVISAGFKELGAPGLELERKIQEQLKRSKLRMIGPNCLGVMNPISGLNATFAHGTARPGNVAFISQSGALCTAVLDWSLAENVGFSAFMSIGSMLDVGWGDLIQYFGEDPRTKSIVIYMESIGDARSFLSAAREVSLTKPIIVIKAGRTDAAAKAAASHTGTLTGSDEVLDAAFRRSGVLRVNNIADIFYMTEVFARQPKPKGPRLMILTNAGGPGVLATDSLIGNGGELAELSPETVQKLDSFLPPHWSRSNAIDILGDAGPDRYAKALEIAAKDPHCDGMMVILTPQGMTDPTQTAERLKPYAQIEGKPFLASWMGGPDVAAGTDILNRANIPTFPYPDTGARVFDYMWQYSYNLKSLYETPAFREENAPNRAEAARIIESVRKSQRTILTEAESKQLLSAYGIPTVETRIARSMDDAVKHANSIGYPIVLKLYSETITHKTDVGGVILNLASAEAVGAAYRRIESSVRERVGASHFQGVTVQPMIKLDGYELIIGSSDDPQFGPVLLFGTGGQLVEVFKDRALGLPPLNSTLARRMMDQTRIFEALHGVRGRKPVDLSALEDLLVRFSQLVVEQPWIKEIDINPLLASPERLLALDARVVVYGSETSKEQLPKTAIRPYPIQYIWQETLKDGSAITLRPIRPEDEPLMVKFHETLSERSVYYRYLESLHLSQRVAHERLIKICFTDFEREMALVAERKTGKTIDGSKSEILGVARLSRLHGTNDARFAVLVGDPFQRQGLGNRLLRQLLEVAKQEKFDRIIGQVLTENQEMRKMCEHLGFRVIPTSDPNRMVAIYEIKR